jgi:hypothetical protein
MPSKYPQDIKSRCQAAVNRYGLTSALIVLEATMPVVPPSRTLYRWRNEKDTQLVGADIAFFEDYDQKLRQRMLPKIERMANELIAATTEAAEQRDSQAANRWGVPMGISVDKALGGGRHGGLNLTLPAPSPGGVIQLAIIGSAEIPAPTVAPETVGIEAESEVVE